jgi:hypothetical protein
MGNCPSGFQPVPTGYGCVVQCPADKNLEFTMVDGKPTCAYKHDKSKFVTLNLLSPFRDPIELPQLQTVNPTVYANYVAERDRFNQQLPVVMSQIEKTTLLTNAFQDLQVAENVRDQSPAAYQEARSKYYTLLKGDAWKEEERQRVMKAEVEPIVRQYQDRYTTIRQQVTDQQRTLDVVKSVKDKVLSVQDELQYSVSIFGKQLSALKNQINMKGRDKEQTAGMFDWFNLILNIVIVVLFVAAIYVIYRKMNKPAYSYGYPY